MQLLKTIIAYLVLTAMSTPAFSQIRVMSYNSAQFHGNPDAMSAVLAEASLDDSHGFAAPVSIYLFQEVDVAELSILQKVVGAAYTMATFTDQNDSSWGGAQAMFYLSTQFVEHTPSHQDIYTYASRHADRWGLDVFGYEDRLYVYSMHLKASTGSANQELRRAGAENVRDDIMLLPAGSKIIVVGDMNFYTPSEPAYQWFTAEGDGQLIDPLGNGAWSSGTHALKHTQSPLLSQNGGLIGGGMDDRFDFQFLSSSMIDGGGFDLISETYRGFGNDGNHYNDAINQGNNNYFPDDITRSNTLADLLVASSDHIPVLADYMVPAILNWEVTGGQRVLVDADASLDIGIENSASVVVPQGADVLHVEVEVTGDLNAMDNISVAALSGLEMLNIPIDTSQPMSWNCLVSLTSTSVDTNNTPQVTELSGEVLSHANPSFSYTEDIDWHTFNIEFELNTGVQTFDVWLFNYGYDGTQSLLEIDEIGEPDAPIYFHGLSTDVVGSIPVLMTFEIDTDAVDTGMYSSFVPIGVSDEDLPGELSTISMLAINVDVVGVDTCTADIAGGKNGGNGVVDVNDLLELIAAWGSTDSPADITGTGGIPDGIVDIADLLELIAQWGPCP